VVRRASEMSGVRGVKRLTVTAMSAKTPTSSLSDPSPSHPHRSIWSLRRFNTVKAIELLANQLRYRTKIKSLRGGPREAPTARPPQIVELPQELVDQIVSHFIYDKRTLLACSTTCYSWYIAAVPHLHHTLTTDDEYDRHKGGEPCLWPRPLRESYNLGLLPLVKQFRIRLGVSGLNEFTPEKLDRHALSYFSALTNLQELGIDCLQVSDFMPNIQQCFGHFSPTLRFLALKEPKGSCREVLYFIGLFPNLQDLKLHYTVPRDEQESTLDATLVPLSIPPLQGRLTLTCFTREKLMKEMISLFGGLRFRQMDLFGVKCVQLLLNACAETLETLRLYPTDAAACRKRFLKRRGQRTQVKIL
jgi:hypothetical protein